MIDYIILFVLALISFLHFLSYLTDKTLFIICCFFFVIRIFDHFFGFSYYFSFFIPIVYYSKLFFLQKEKSIYLIGFIKRFKYLIFFLFINLAISCLVAVNFHDYSDFNFLTLIFNIFKNFLRLISIILLIKYIIDSKKYINCGFYAILIATFISAITEIYTFIFGHNLQYIITGIGHQYDIAAGLKAFRISGLSYEPRYMSFVSIISIIILLTNFLYKNKLPTNKELFLTFFYFLIFLLTFSTSGYFLFILIIAFIIPSFKRFFTLNLKKIIFSFVSFFFIVFIGISQTAFYHLSSRLNLIEFYKFNYFPVFFNFFEHHDKLAITLLDTNPLFLFGGMGYGMIKFFDAHIAFAIIGEPSLTRINFPFVADCCDPFSGFVLCLSSFGIFISLYLIKKLFLFLILDKNNIWAFISLLYFFYLPPGPLSFMIIALAIINFKTNLVIK